MNGFTFFFLFFTLCFAFANVITDSRKKEIIPVPDEITSNNFYQISRRLGYYKTLEEAQGKLKTLSNINMFSLFLVLI